MAKIGFRHLNRCTLLKHIRDDLVIRSTRTGVLRRATHIVISIITHRVCHLNRHHKAGIKHNKIKMRHIIVQHFHQIGYVHAIILPCPRVLPYPTGRSGRNGIRYPSVRMRPVDQPVAICGIFVESTVHHLFHYICIRRYLFRIFFNNLFLYITLLIPCDAKQNRGTSPILIYQQIARCRVN